jgi:hypothetical protein
VQIPDHSFPLPAEVHGQAALPVHAAGPPDDCAGETHGQQEQCTGAVHHASGSTGQQVEVQVLQRPNERSVIQLAKHRGRHRIEQQRSKPIVTARVRQIRLPDGRGRIDA